MLKTNENRPGVASGELEHKKPRVRRSFKTKNKAISSDIHHTVYQTAPFQIRKI